MENSHQSKLQDQEDAVPEGPRYDAFISYVREEPDIEVAVWLQRALESFRVPPDLVREKGFPARLKPIFLDDSDLAATPSLRGALRKELQKSRFLIVICSLRVTRSRWVNDEIQEFRALGRSNHILAVLVDGEPADAFPEALKRAVETGETAAPATSDTLLDGPLAADLRPRSRFTQRKLRRVALLRIVATILGCDYDDLVKRTRERDARNRRRMLTGLAGFLAVLGCAILFGMYQLSEARNYKLSTDLKTKELENQTLLTEKAEEAKKANLALAHYGRGLEAEVERNFPAAKLQFAKSLSILDTPEARKKLADTWFTARFLWDGALPTDPRLDGKPMSNRAEQLSSVCFSNDETHLFVGTSSGQVLVFAAEVGTPIASLSTESPVRKLAMNPTKSRLAVGCEDGTVLILNPENGEIDLRLHNTGPVSALGFSSDGNALAIGFESGGMKVVDSETGEPWFRSPPGQHEVEVESVAFAPHSQEMIWAMGRWLYVSNVATGWMSIVTPQDDTIMGTAWGPGSDPLLAWAGLDGPIQLMRRHDDAAEGRATILAGQKREKPMIKELPGHSGGGISALSFLPDGNTLVSAGYDGDVRTWNARNGTLNLLIPCHKGSIAGLSISPKGDLLATTGVDNRVRTWRLHAEQGEELWNTGRLSQIDTYRAGLGAYAIDELASISDDQLLVGLRNGSVYQWKPRSETQPLLAENDGTRERQDTWLLSPDKKKLGVITGAFGELIAILTGKPRITIYDLPDCKSKSDLAVESLEAAAWLDADKIVTGNHQGQVQVWDVTSRKVSKILGERKPTIAAVGVSVSAHRVAALWEDGYLTIWEGPQFNAVFSQRVSEYPVLALRLAPDGRSFVVTTRGAVGQVRLWDVGTKSVRFERIGWARSLAFTSDSHVLALGSDTDGEIWLIDVITGRAMATVRGHARRVKALSFNPSGTILYSAGEEQSIRSWSLALFIELSKQSGAQLFSTSERETGLVLRGLVQELRRVVGQGPQKQNGVTSIPLSVKDLEDLLSATSDVVQPLLVSADSNREEGNNIADIAKIEGKIREELRKCSQLIEKGKKDVRLERLRCSLFMVLADALKAQSRTEEAIGAYVQGTEAAGKAFQGHDDRIWPTLLKCHDRYADVLRELGKPSEAFAVEGTRIRIQEALTEKKALLAPPLVDLWTHFEKAINPLEGKEREEKGLRLAQDCITFLKRRLESTPNDADLLLGLATFCEGSAAISLEPEHFEDAKASLITAERARAQVVEIFAKKSDPRAGKERVEWAATLSNLAAATYHAAIQAYENPHGKKASRESTIDRLKEAAEFAKHAWTLFKAVAEDQELPAKAAQTISVLRTTASLIELNLNKLQSKAPAGDKKETQDNEH